MKFEPQTAKNVQILYQILAALRDPQAQSQEDKSLSSNSLTLEEKGFLDFFSSLSFTAHHSTPAVDLPEIRDSGALMSLKERVSKDELVQNSHTNGGAARRNFIYCTLGVDGKFISPGFIGSDKDKVTFTLPLTGTEQKEAENLCFQQVISALSISNHDFWFQKEARTDPIKINDVTRHIQFTKTDKLYIYHNQKTGVIWQRKVPRQQEIFYAQNDFAEISHILGLQLLIELYSFKGSFCQKLLKDPHQHRSIIIKLFQQLFPSEIYPEIQIKGKIPLDTFPGLIIDSPDKQIDQVIAIADALEENQAAQEILPLMNESLPLDASITTTSPCAGNLVTLATEKCYTVIVAHLAQLGARLQLTSLNNPDNILTISLGEYNRLAKNYDWLYQCLVGFSQRSMPEVMQQFDLSRIVNSTHPAIVTLLEFCWLKPYDHPKTAKSKQKILEYLTAHIKLYDPWVGLIASTYHYIYKKSRRRENLLPLLNWLLEQKCDINLPGKSSKTSLWELAEENQDHTVKEWAEKNGAVPAIENKMTFTDGDSAVGGIVFTEYKGEMRVLLVEKPNYWCGPGGLIEAKESSFEALLREIKEETSLDLSDSKFESTARYCFQVEKDCYRRELYYLKLHGNKLPWIKPEDDVEDARWVKISDLDFKAVPVLYNGKPILTSNSLLIQAKTLGIPEESSIETALYYESDYGTNEFDRELSLEDLSVMDHVIPKGIILAKTNAVALATGSSNKTMLAKIFAQCGNKLSKLDSEHIALGKAYQANRNFVFYLIEAYQAEWRTVQPSFIGSVLQRLDFPLIKYLISRKEKLSSTFFNYCITQFIFFQQLDLLKILSSYYPEQSVRQFAQEEHLIFAAKVSFPIFESLFIIGKAKISKKLLNSLKQIKNLEDGRQYVYSLPSSLSENPSMGSISPEKSPSIYSVMEFIDKLLAGPLKDEESEIKSNKMRLLPPPSSSAPTTQTTPTLMPQT